MPDFQGMPIPDRYWSALAIWLALTMAVLDKKLGHTGKIDSSRNVVGGQVWFNYSETWRVEGSPNQFLIADGHVTWRSAPTDEVADKPVGAWALITFAPECLP